MVKNGRFVPVKMMCWSLVAAIVASCPAWAAETSLPLCQALADGYGALVTRNPDAALDPAGGGNGRAGSIYPMSPVETLASDPASGFRLARTIMTLTDYTDDAFVSAAEKLPESFTPSPALLQEMSDDENQYVEIQHLPGSPYYLALGVQGTAHCALTTWFTVEGGKTKPLAGPKSWEPSDGGNCGIDATFGSLDGTPVAIIDGGGGLTPDMSVSATLSARTPAGWAPDCTATFDFSPRFDVERVVNPPETPQPACKDEDCLKLRDAALALLEAFQAGPQAAQEKALSGLTPDGRAAFDKMKLAWKPAGKGADDAGNATPQASDLPADALDTQPFVLPLQLDDRIYLVTIGHRTIGWRVFSDYEVDVYALKHGALDQVRSFLMGMARGKFVKATVKDEAQ